MARLFTTPSFFSLCSTNQCFSLANRPDKTLQTPGPPTTGLYARFPTPASAVARQLLSDYIYQTWLPQSTYRLNHPVEILSYTG